MHTSTTLILLHTISYIRLHDERLLYSHAETSVMNKSKVYFSQSAQMNKNAYTRVYMPQIKIIRTVMGVVDVSIENRSLLGCVSRRRMSFLHHCQYTRIQFLVKRNVGCLPLKRPCITIQTMMDVCFYKDTKIYF